MPIDLRPIIGKAIDPATDKSTVSRKHAPQNTDNRSRELDSVALTDTAARLKQAMASGAVINTALIERVAGQLEAGTYEIDAEHIAEKMIEMERRLSVEEQGDE
ncbi:flagellar biosynthesis anti-sigma factor FlgM [Methylohalobius crimeensis]|uniref:flagellar biosynthesis anti-sigma factor FlgM n=1 Tax=Methylohalobius crimeensis TaxID=244365 RepID=UPI0003B60E96|nr:flagellar biosynthesis anti-sigma factor FlgM [Methylohalobius crimeensis]